MRMIRVGYQKNWVNDYDSAQIVDTRWIPISACWRHSGYRNEGVRYPFHVWELLRNAPDDSVMQYSISQKKCRKKDILAAHEDSRSPAGRRLVLARSARTNKALLPALRFGSNACGAATLACTKDGEARRC